MSLDSIVHITIDTKNLPMAQAGFGVPLILAPEEELSDHRIKIFKDISDLKSMDEKSSSYKMAKVLLAQDPRVWLAKVGLVKKEETIADALKNIINEDSDFYGILLVNRHGEDDAYKKDILSLAETIIGKRFLAGVDVTDNQLDIVQELKSKNYANIFCCYQTDVTESLAAALMGKMLSKTPGSVSWAFKDLIGIKPQQIALDINEKLKTLNINRYISIADVGITLDGKVANGEYIDILHGRAWLQVRMQERLFRLFMLNDKIPFTDKGLDLVRSEILAQLSDGVNRGFLAQDPKPQVYIPPLAEINAEMREKRILPDVSFSARAAGAIHEIEIRGTITF